MKNITLLGNITLVLGVLMMSPFEYAVAEQDDVETRRCHFEVQETMAREGIKQLYPADQKKVNESCTQGNFSLAIRLVEGIGTYKKCVGDLDAFIHNNQLDVTMDVHNRAQSLCRQGDLREAIAQVSEAPSKYNATPAQIISFLASTGEVKKGSAVNLSWHTTNANTVMLGTYGTNDFQKVAASGSLSVSPLKSTTYVLMVGQSTKGPSAMTSKKLQVGVSLPTNETCVIEGKLEGKWRQQIQMNPQGPTSTWTVDLGIYIVGSDKPLKGAFVSERGIYRFTDLSTGEKYTVRPSWESAPRQGNVSCTDGITQRGPTFKITGSPLID